VAVDPISLNPDSLGPVSRGLPELTLELRVRDPELVDELSAILDPRERETFALAALRVGVLALRSARGQVDAQTVRGEVERLLAELRKGLDQHRDHLQLELGGALRDYFDPKSGRFEERVRALTQDDGELARVIRRHVEGSDSALAQTLARHVGSDSPLLRALDPANAEGVVAGLTRLVEEALGSQRERILREFSLDNREGALARLVGELTQSHGKLTEDLRGRLDEVVAEFSLDAEDSALSRLVRQVERAQQQITSEFTLDSETSALARMRRELLGIAEQQNKALAELQAQVQVELAKLSTARAASARSTAHGNDFEAALLGWFERRAQESGDAFAETGRTTGHIKNCKKGDAVVELGPDHRAAGARIVIEAKEEAGYTLAAARVELEEARKNRDAEVGVFVLSAKVAADAWPRFHPVGDDVFLVWDFDEPGTDVRLEAALGVARALCTRRRHTAKSEIDFAALDRAIREVEKQLEGLDAIKSAADGVESGAGRIKERVRIMRANLARAVETLDRCSEAVRCELGGSA
jgi:hypothetical protein